MSIAPDSRSENKSAPRSEQESGNPQSHFLNAELSWLAFNKRVLEEAENPKVPLLERVRFLAISACNLEEFFAVRVAGLLDLQKDYPNKLSSDGLTPAQQLKKILYQTTVMCEQQEECWRRLKEKLAGKNINLLDKETLSPRRKIWLEQFFIENIFPVITPIAVDPAHPFPLLANGSVAVIYALEGEKPGTQILALITLPQKLPRFVRLPDDDKKIEFIALEDVLDIFIESLFPGYKPLQHGLFQVLRDSDFAVNDKAEDLVVHYEKALKERKHGEVISLTLSKDMPKGLRLFLVKNLKVQHNCIFETEGFMGLSTVKEFVEIDRPDLKFPSFNPRYPERIMDYNGDCFAAIKAKDIVIHHPYESFDVVLHFVRQAASDPDVISIKQTLYRTSSNSPIVKALIEAAENGKAVTAVIELKARFDEEANIRFARDMERAGVQVVYGIVALKTHAKISLITKKVGRNLQSFLHLGTGNYHPVTAKIYTDISFFTCNPVLCHDAAKIFNYLTGYAQPKDLKKLVISPHGLRKKCMELINDEIEHAKAGRPAGIWAKMNSLIDEGIVEALYKASQAGVHIELVVRGICTLRPGVPGLSENIRVHSIIGRFLEHSRIFCFGNGHELPSPEARVFISSADLRTRNLDRRVEYMVELENETVHEQVLSQIMAANLLDDVQSWELDSEGNYHRVASSGKMVSAHQYFMNNPSLSGRGSAQEAPKIMPARFARSKGHGASGKPDKNSKETDKA